MPTPTRRASVRDWLAGARPRTLPAAVVPVAVGTAVAAAEGHDVAWRAVAALVVALALQVATNYGNDFSDGVRGTDTDRVGPVRLVAGGLSPPRRVLAASLAAFAVAGVAGLALAAATSWWLVAVGALCMAAGWLYTGGPLPYGYRALGEASVLVFFGLVAVTGTAFVQLDRVAVLAVVAGVPVGLLAVALLVVNNLRDIPSDTAAGKRTLAVMLGDGGTRGLYGACLLLALLVVPVLAVARPGALLALLAAPALRAPWLVVRAGTTGPALVPALGATGRAQLVYGALLAVGLLL